MSVTDAQYPEDTETTLYFMSGFASLQDIIDRCESHFPDTKFEDLNIESQNIQIRCFGYDLYDGNDWCQYIVVTKRG